MLQMKQIGNFVLESKIIIHVFFRFFKKKRSKVQCKLKKKKNIVQVNRL